MGKPFLKLACLLALLAIVALGGFQSVEAESEEEDECFVNSDCEEYENSSYDCYGECVEYHCDDGVCYCECISPDRKVQKLVYLGNKDAATVDAATVDAANKSQNNKKRP